MTDINSLAEQAANAGTPQDAAWVCAANSAYHAMLSKLTHADTWVLIKASKLLMTKLDGLLKELEE